MGNKESNESLYSQDEDDDERHAVTPSKPAISKEVFKLFLKATNKLCIHFSEDQFEVIRHDLKEMLYPPGSLVLQEGSEALGLFVVIQGTCNVIASDGKTVIRQLTTNDIFGEVSTLYNVPCTCSIIVSEPSNCSSIFLERSRIEQLMNNINDAVPLRSWFVQQNYLDSSCLFSPGDIPKEIACKGMLKCPLFNEWSEESLLEVLEQLPKEFIEIHQPGTFLFYEVEEDISPVLILNGSVELLKGDRSILTLNSSNEYIFLAEESLFVNRKMTFSVRVLQTCQAVTFHQQYFSPMLKKYPIECSRLMELKKRWEMFFENTFVTLDDIDQVKSNPFLVNRILKKTKIFTSISPDFLQIIALSMEFLSFTESSIIAEYNEEFIDNPFLFVMITGSAAVLNASITLKLIKQGNEFFFNSKFPENCLVRAEVPCMIGKIYKSLIDDLAMRHTGIVINVKW